MSARHGVFNLEVGPAELSRVRICCDLLKVLINLDAGNNASQISELKIGSFYPLSLSIYIYIYVSLFSLLCEIIREYSFKMPTKTCQKK